MRIKNRESLLMIWCYYVSSTTKTRGAARSIKQGAWYAVKYLSTQAVVVTSGFNGSSIISSNNKAAPPMSYMKWSLNKFGQVWTSLEKLRHFWTNWDKFRQIWTRLSQFGQFWTCLNQYELTIFEPEFRKSGLENAFFLVQIDFFFLFQNRKDSSE